jgi:hypothetical protein
MKRIDQAEINYIFSDYTNNNNYGFHQPASVNDSIVRVLTKNPVIALSAAWKHSIKRSGLTPFTIHYLTGSELPIEDFMKKYFSRKYINHGFCYSTNLPVVSCNITRNWQSPYQMQVQRATSYFRSTQEERHYFARRDLRFAELHRKLNIDKAIGLVDDEYMRQFGNHPIPKNIWTYLKGVAGIYK